MEGQAVELTEMLKKFLKGPTDKADAKRTFKQLQSDINQFTKTKECWGIVLQILSTEESLEIKYFASNILKDKMKYDYGQLTPKVFATVHDSILKIAIQHPKPETGMLFNLSLALVYVYMQEAESIGGLLQYLFQYLGKYGLINYVFTILMILPEEVDNYKVVIDEVKRSYLYEYIRSIQTKVLVELNTIAAQHWEPKTIRRQTLLGCFANWVELQYKKQIMEELPKHFVMNAAIQYIGDAAVGKECCETLITIIKTLSNPEQDKLIYLFFAERIFKYFDIAKKYIEKNQVDMCDYYIRVLCSFGRKLAPDFVKQCGATSMQFHQNLMFLTQHAGLDNMEAITKYWIKFLSKLYNTNSPTKVAYKQLLEHLYEVLSKNGQFSIAECQDLNAHTEQQLEKAHQDFEDKMRYRNSIDEVFEFIGELITFQRCVEISLASIYKLNISRKSFWVQLEALLLPLVHIVDKIRNPNPILTQTIGKLAELNPPYTCVQRSVIIVLSRCSKIYKSNLDVTKTIFSFLVKQLKQPQLASIAAEAFENVCDNNTDFVVSNIQSFMQVFTMYKENQKILNGMVLAVAAKQEYLAKYLPEICRPYVEQIARRSSVDSLKTAIKRINQIIEKASKGGDCEAIILELFRTVWTLIKPFVQNPSVVPIDSSKNQSIRGLIQRSCKFLKACMRSLRKSFAPYIQQVFQTIFKAYQTHPFASYVYTVEVAVTVFNSYEEFINPLNIIYLKTCELTFAHLSKLENFQQNPELAEDFFGMNLRFMRYAPHIILYCAKLDNLVKLCIIACGVDHRQIANSLYRFIESLFHVFWSPPLICYYNEHMADKKQFQIVIYDKYSEGYNRLKKILLDNTVIVNRMMQHLANSPSQSVRQSIRNALQAEVQAFPKQNMGIWTPILMEMGDDILTAREKQAFLNLLPTAGFENSIEIQEYIYSISKRYVHRNTRAVVK